jgi:uncharacterized repeat protein (TIGR01451 family)
MKAGLMIDKKIVLIVLLALSLIESPAFAASPNVTLALPQDGYVSQNDYLELSCNASDDKSISTLALYTDVAGNFSMYGLRGYGELQPGLDHTALCHLNGNLSCWNSDESIQTNLSQNGVSYEQGKVGWGARVSPGDYLRFETDGVLNSDEGTVEFWVMPKSLLSGTMWLFFMGTSDSPKNDQVRLYINSTGYLVLEWYDDSGDMSYTYADVSWWQNDTWYHVGIFWGIGDGLLISINGSDSLQGPTVMLGSDYTSIPAYAYIGGKSDSTGQLDAVFDEFIAFDYVLDISEIQSHYESNFADKPDASETWNVTSVPDGSYTWSCYAADNESNIEWNSSNYTFYIDTVTPPSVDGVGHLPADIDSLDPGVTVNVTANITDYSGVNASILQYRRLGLSEWTNITMNNVSAYEWNASFAVPLPPDTWEYRIFSNDSIGNSDYSATYNFSTDYDYTWSSSPASLGEVYVLFGTNESLGVLTINNTGDYPLNFRLVSGFSETYYNISGPDSFDIPAKESKPINISVTAPPEPGEYTVSVQVDATSGDAEPGESWINTTVISYWGGPYLTVSITESEDIVWQSSSGLNYSARVKNIGNDTATDVWINWTLPAGWSNVSGNVSTFVGNITNGSVVWSNISVSLGADAEAGVASVAVNANCGCPLQ